MAIESIVRPFARPDSLSRKRLVASREKIEVEPAVISWGRAGTLPTAHQIEAIDETGINFQVINLDDKYTEIDRKVDVRRIEQQLPNGTTNPDNYIDLERPYSVRFEKVDLASSRVNETQVWATSIETTAFRTMNPDQNRKAKSVFNLNRNLS